MIEFTPALAGRARRTALFDEWRELLAADMLSTAGLIRLRGRLDLTSGEFQPGPDLELLGLQLDDVLAAHLDVPADELPGRTPLPDFPPTA
jgi:hypothetical protein